MAGKSDPPRAWQRMLSGRRLDLLDPSPYDIEIEDIAHGLARVARWNGQTHGPHAFSVAQHCVLVERLVTLFRPDIDRRWRLAALLHDAPEYVIGDMISPFKAALGLDYKAFRSEGAGRGSVLPSRTLVAGSCQGGDDPPLPATSVSGVERSTASGRHEKAPARGPGPVEVLVSE